MTLNNDDLKKLNLMMKKAVIDGTGEALEAMVFPKFESIDQKFESIDQKFEKIDKDLSSLKKEVGLNTEAIARVERKLDQVTDHQAVKLDDHEKRIVRLENVALA